MGDAKYGKLFTEKDIMLVGLAVQTGAARTVADALYKLDADGKATFPADEPLFLLRGKDLAVPATLSHYAGKCVLLDAGRSHRDNVKSSRVRIEAWQREHPDRCKVPD